MAADVVMYRTPLCPYCIRANHLLRRKGAAFREIEVFGDRATRAWLAEVTGRRTVPQVFINGVSVGGFDELCALDRAGRLDRMLAENPCADAPLTPNQLAPSRS
jgi:glutaredoxin 3